MKIAVYEAREDELAALQAAAKGQSCELRILQEIPGPENASAVEGCEGVSSLGQGSLDEKLLTLWAQKGVRYISTRTVGYDHIDLRAAARLGIRVCNAEYSPNGVADFTVMMLLMCLRNYKQALWRGQVNDFSLPGLMGRDLKSLTVGVIGSGRIGTQVLANLSGFGCRLLYYSRKPNKTADRYAQYVNLQTLYRECDAISLHMPLTPETEHMINDESIAQMKDGVILINCARGALTDIHALVRGVESRKIGALGMDTVEGDESIVHGDHRVDILANRDWFYLHQFRNVIMTQHMAFYTKEAVDSMAFCGIEGIAQMARGETCKRELLA